MIDSFEQLLQTLDKIQGASAVALVCLSCIVIGYVLRFIKPFPNSGIPVVVILWGAIAMLGLSDPHPTAMQPHVWVVRNFFAGLIIGFVAWLIHNIVLSKIENYIQSKYPSATDTTFFSNKQQSPQPPAVPPEPPKP